MKKNKVVIVGTGMVGMSYAYSMVNQGTCEELVLIDLDKKRAEGEAIDLNHGLSFAPRKMNIYAGDYSDCKDAYLICITAGAIQLEGETRLDLLHKNTKIMKSIVNEIKKSGFDGIILVAANPVDIMTYVCWKLSGYDKSKVIGSGTTLDSARLMYTLGERLDVNPKDINAYVIGEHGDSQFVAWSYALCGVQPIYQIASRKDSKIRFEDLEKIEDEVRNIAYKIIECKKSTYYGIGMALTRITKAILENENSVLTVSSYLNGEYGHDDVYIAVPSIVNENGVREVIHLPLDNEEKEKLDKSVEIMKENINKLDI
ncbi:MULTISPECIES: L-lactate dehydrogenase [Romboutsia]|jgi:L-lactate dehydrogenase|uniref:L-lactate dehydrogenase n=3 Tax=Romboutsia ilealis TaxID=1115758 RepID=A0A1V1HZZ8_9FIRM|nr:MULTISPECIES: L-lactate dehydrogenase [Romboutsia]MCI9062598.1 L-lactate dehydrogenase [Romboutsia sp.]MCI9260796.1 L-lactate dehydrogenase [Romboutsia sp.]CED93437.1 L-lactate dehydrogenase 2 [Romboutsia ilealis]